MDNINLKNNKLKGQFSILTIIRVFSCNYRIRKQNIPCSYFFCTNNVGCIYTVSGCRISTIVRLRAGAYFIAIWILAPKTFLIEFQCLLKGKLQIQNGKTAGFKCWLKWPRNRKIFPQRSLQDGILISGSTRCLNGDL